MTIEELLNQELMSKYPSGEVHRAFFRTLNELLTANVIHTHPIYVPTQEQADLLNGYALVQGIKINVKVDTRQPYIYRAI